MSTETVPSRRDRGARGRRGDDAARLFHLDARCSACRRSGSSRSTARAGSPAASTPATSRRRSRRRRGLALGPDDVVAPLNREQACHFARGVTVADVLRNFLGKRRRARRSGATGTCTSAPRRRACFRSCRCSAISARRRRRGARVQAPRRAAGGDDLLRRRSRLDRRRPRGPQPRRRPACAGGVRDPEQPVRLLDADGAPDGEHEHRRANRGGWSIPCERVDGTDALAVYEASARRSSAPGRAGARRRSRRSRSAGTATPRTTTRATSRPRCARSTAIRSSDSPRGCVLDGRSRDEVERCAGQPRTRSRPGSPRRRQRLRPTRRRSRTASTRRRYAEPSLGDARADIGLIGLAVMGQNLALNMGDHGFSVAVYNRTTSQGGRVPRRAGGRARSVIGAHSLEELVAALKRPRRVMHDGEGGHGRRRRDRRSSCRYLEPGDIVIDGGNSHFPDTSAATRAPRAKGLLFVGTGVSGGEEGARHGPSIMPGGDPAAWPHVKDDLPGDRREGRRRRAVLRLGRRGRRRPLREDGAQRHRVRRHAADRRGLRPAAATRSASAHDELHDVFAEWNDGELDSYLIEITRDIFGRARTRTASRSSTRSSTPPARRAPASGRRSRRSTSACRVTLIAEAVFARCLSALKDERVAAAELLDRPGGRARRQTSQAFVDDVRDALYASKIVSLRAGLHAAARAPAKEYGWT